MSFIYYWQTSCTHVAVTNGFYFFDVEFSPVAEPSGAQHDSVIVNRNIFAHVNTQYQVKDGLYFQLSKIPFQRENISFLKNSGDRISLTCIFQGMDCKIDFGAANYAHQMEFTFHNHFLENFATPGEEFSIKQFPTYQLHEVCCTSQMILHDIIICKLSGAFKNMFMESKALSLLLCFQKSNNEKQLNCSSCKFLAKPVEKEKILKAKQIVLNNLTDPPTIQELSLQIGINQCYLKKGFKEIFGTTIYDFVQEQRMLKAKLLLTTTDYTVSQVAEHIGFSSQSNFSSAFKKFTGVFPSELQQN